MKQAQTTSSFLTRFVQILVQLTIGVGILYVFYSWTNQLDTTVTRASNHRQSAQTALLPWIPENKDSEGRIARHFEADTLPGLMRCGLVKKYERYKNGTIVFVTGEIWKQRSRFFKESLLAEAVVYNKVHGYSLETRIIDHRSRQLYARAVSAAEKEFYD
jgi:hypothetical protein